MIATILWAALMVALAAVAGGAVLVGVLLLKPTIEAGRAATGTAEGSVVEIDRVENEDESLHYPVYRFPAEGGERTVRSVIGWVGRPPYRVGQPVRLFYPPGRPEEARPARYEGISFPLVLLVVGAGFLIATLYELVRMVV